MTMRADRRLALRRSIAECLRVSPNGLMPARARGELAKLYETSLSTVDRETTRLRRELQLAAGQHSARSNGLDLTSALDHTNPEPSPDPVDAPHSQPHSQPDAQVRRRLWWEDADTAAQVRTVVASAPTVASAHRRLTDQGILACGYPSFTRQLKRYMPPAVHASLTAHGKQKGREAYLGASLYCTIKVEIRNERWQADCLEIPVRALRKNGSVAESLWLIAFLDEATRVITAWSVVEGRPTGELVRATLASGLMTRIDSYGQVVGGIPRAIMWDNGREFLNEAVGRTCTALGIAATPAPPYSGWRKGKIERFFRTIEAMFFDEQLGAVHGPKTFTGQRPWRGDDTDLSSIESIVIQTGEWIDKFNNEHRHSTIKMTPMAAWNADPAELRVADPEQIHPMMVVEPKPRIVAKDGISFNNEKWLAPEMRLWRRRRLEVRYLPGREHEIECFDPETGEHVCTAVPASRMDPRRRQELVIARNRDYATVRSALNAGAAQRRDAAVIRHVLDAEAALQLNQPATEDAGPREPRLTPSEDPAAWPDLDLGDFEYDGSGPSESTTDLDLEEPGDRLNADDAGKDNLGFDAERERP